MKEQEILEGNRLIAEFREGIIRIISNPLYNAVPFTVVDLFVEENGVKKGFTHTFELKDLKYHSSWDWLMPVWFGILKWGKSEYGINWEQSIGEWFIHIKINKGELEINWLNTNRIENVWFVVVEFIKWYNSCQKEK